MRISNYLCGILLALAAPPAMGAGLWPDLPIIGQPSYCAAFVTGSTGPSGITGQPQGLGTGITCQVTVPAGPPLLTGNEALPLDVYGSIVPSTAQGGSQPQTAKVSVGLIAPGSIGGGSMTRPKNLFRNGDITENPFQSGVTISGINTPIQTGADGFRYLGGAASAVTVSRQTGAADIVAGQFSVSLRFGRGLGNADTTTVCQISVLTSAVSQGLQGQHFVYSFWAIPGPTFTAANGNITITAGSGTGTDQSSTLFTTGAWTGYTNDITSSGSQNPLAVSTVSAGVATFSTLSVPAGWNQYWVAGVVPSTATQFGIQLCWTPKGTAVAGDYIETSNHQTEVVGPSTITPSAFEHETSQEGFADAYRELYILLEPAAGVRTQILCQASSATVVLCAVPLPQAMRVPPVATITPGGFSSLVAAGTSATGCIVTAPGVSTFLTGNLLDTCAAASFTAGNASWLVGGSGGGSLAYSAEL